jgi:hypothetical protein
MQTVSFPSGSVVGFPAGATPAQINSWSKKFHSLETPAKPDSAPAVLLNQAKTSWDAGDEVKAATCALDFLLAYISDNQPSTKPTLKT